MQDKYLARRDHFNHLHFVQTPLINPDRSKRIINITTIYFNQPY